MKNQLLKFSGTYALLTIVLGVLPFIIYGIERKYGLLPTSEEWYAAGTNHGPWRWGLESFLIYYPILILLIATVLTFLFRGIKGKSWNLIAIGTLLVLVQIGILFAQMYFLTWTID